MTKTRRRRLDSQSRDTSIALDETHILGTTIEKIKTNNFCIFCLTNKLQHSSTMKHCQLPNHLRSFLKVSYPIKLNAVLTPQLQKL